MEQRTEDTSGASTRRNSTNGLQESFQEQLSRKAYQPQTVWETNTYKRFRKTPAVLSSVLMVLVWLAAVVIAMSPVDGRIDGILLFLYTCLISAVAFLAAVWIKIVAASTMVRSRVRKWLDGKFDSWDEASGWISKTHHIELDHIAGLPDDSWMPNVAEGGKL